MRIYNERRLPQFNLKLCMRLCICDTTRTCGFRSNILVNSNLFSKEASQFFHLYIYIYIYIEKERGEESENKSEKHMSQTVICMHALQSQLHIY
jgi:hypothetical protein